MRLLVTGAAGFIGANFVNWLFSTKKVPSEVERVVVLDSLTYAGNLRNLQEVESETEFSFVRGDIRDEALCKRLLVEEKIDSLVNFAAESHVDRSILSPLEFVRTNIEGTQVLINASKDAGVERYLQVSTDEVYGSLGPEGRFYENTPLEPSSAYSASKAASDLLVLAAYRTHGFSAFVTRCTNNYGPYQFPEKLLPLFITNALSDIALPLYGDGKNVRAWLHVDDHSSALYAVLSKGRFGEVYNIGPEPESEKENIEVTTLLLEELGKSQDLLRYVEDRKGHDRRYAVSIEKIKSELGWSPSIDFKTGLKKTINWYLENCAWWEEVKSGEYQKYYEANYGSRLTEGTSARLSA